MLASQVCKYADFGERWYRRGERALRIRRLYAGHSAAQLNFVNRKFWEWIVISKALEERRMLKRGRRGLGFAVGQEPLAAHFAAKGCSILATDLDPDVVEPGWVQTGQHASAKNQLFKPELVRRDRFDKRVDFAAADMRTLEGLEPGYDFIWSSCALEHLGSLGAGIEFILQSSRLLRPGGVAVHTTEFNVRSNDETIETGPSVIYRRRDISALGSVLADRQFTLVRPDFDSGNHRVDLDADPEPHMTNGKPHVKLVLGDHVCTSMLLIIERPR